MSHFQFIYPLGHFDKKLKQSKLHNTQPKILAEERSNFTRACLILEIKLNHMKNHNYYVYILTNINKNVLYTGVTNSVEKRVQEHKAVALGQKRSANPGWKFLNED